jgi:hypothetical protein
MKRAISVVLLMCAAASIQAKDKPTYEKGVLLQMDFLVLWLRGKRR